MSAANALQQFIDDELLRAPLLAEQVIEGAIEVIRKDAVMSPRERALAADLVRGLLSSRSLVVREFSRELGAQVAKGSRSGDSTRSGLPTGPAALSLVDEGEVEVDVEISRAIEAIRALAEQELRDVMSYTSSLVGDMDVARDYNPFRPEVIVRSFWTAAQALPMARPYQLALMRHACGPLAQLVRKSYAGACARLQAQGVEPAVYRTIIVYGGRGRSAGQAEAQPGAQDDQVDIVTDATLPRLSLDQALTRTDEVLRNLPADGDRQQRERLRNLQQRQLIDSAERPADREQIELIGRLFDAVLGDRRLAPDMQNLVSRLQAPATRLTLRDPGTLDNYTHPVWLLMDRLALQGDLHPPEGDPERTRMLRFAHGLLDTLAQEQARDADAFRWARERVMAYERHRFEQRREAAQAERQSLQDLEDRAMAADGTLHTMPGPLDVGQLDTVPAELIDHLPAAAADNTSEAAAWLQSRRSGEWVRMFMQGDWVHAQLLWYGTHREYWLFGDGASPATWAVRRRALERLYAQQLLGPLAPRSLIRDAANRVLNHITTDTKRRG